jgi:hypothetical protein
MIISQKHLNQLMPIEQQRTEIQRVKNASVGEVLFVVQLNKNTDIPDTILSMAQVGHIIHIQNFKIQYIKS